ncbi:hypothetical protein OC846_004344 [Tilletia horrida]|uniref:Uncharacterized protein n=1 Tax=Tilletia horrida TaxID=155126 RepID=A0AAN6GNC4_9BASI|nr:hypothetical protein OC845_004397 [Tilletia horrida]KAK0548770.1 hypothetical protein OC846_004344 [Tilletia horrida]
MVTPSADSPPSQSFSTSERGGSDNSSLHVGQELKAALRMMRAPSVLGAGEDIDFTDERVFRESDITRSRDKQAQSINTRCQNRSSVNAEVAKSHASAKSKTVPPEEKAKPATSSKARPSKAVERQAASTVVSSVAPLRIRPKKATDGAMSASQDTKLPRSTNVSSRATSLAPSRVGSNIGALASGAARSDLQKKKAGPSKLGTGTGLASAGGINRPLVSSIPARTSVLSQLQSAQMQISTSESSVYSQTSAPDTVSSAASVAEVDEAEDGDGLDHGTGETERERSVLTTSEEDQHSGSDTEIDESATAALRIIQTALEKALGCESSTGSSFVDTPLRRRVRTGSDADSSSSLTSSSSGTLVQSLGCSSSNSVNMSSSTSLASSDDSESSAASMRVLGGNSKAKAAAKKKREKLDAKKVLTSRTQLLASKMMEDEPSKQSFATSFSVSSSISRLRPPQARGLPEEIQELLHSLAVSTSAELRNQSMGVSASAKGDAGIRKTVPAASSSMAASSTLRGSTLQSGPGPSRTSAIGTIQKPAPLRLKSLKLCKEVNSSRLSTASSARKMAPSSSSASSVISGSSRLAVLREARDLRASPSLLQKERRRGSAWTTSSGSSGSGSMFPTTSMATTETNTSQTTYRSSRMVTSGITTARRGQRQSRLPVPVGSASSSRATSVDSEMSSGIGISAGARLPPSTLIRQIQKAAFAAAASGVEA